MTLALLLLLHAPPAHAVDASVHFEWAQHAYAAGQYTDALAQYDAIMKLVGESGAVRNNRALCYLALSQYEKALWEAERAVQLNPSNGRFSLTLAVIQLSMNPPDLKEARSNLLRAVKYMKRTRDREGLGNACYNLGVLAQRRRRYEEAASWYRQSLDWDPSNEDSREALGIIAPEEAG